MAVAHLEAPEFIKRVMEGERDFSGIKLTDRDTVDDHIYTFLELGEYLKKQDLKSSPIILDEAELEGIRAGVLWIPYLRANQASFKNAYFPNANFEHGDFRRSSFYNTQLQQANCSNCNFSSAYFKHTTLHSTILTHADFRMADMADARDLGAAKDLGLAKFGRTKVSAAELKEIVKALESTPGFNRATLPNLFRTA